MSNMGEGGNTTAATEVPALALPEEIYVWEIIVIQARKMGQRRKAACSVKFGDKMERTHTVDEDMPLWNLWLQMSEDKDVSTMAFTVWEETEGEEGQGTEVGTAVIPLEALRKRPGKSEEKWHKLYIEKAGKNIVTDAELHLSITFEGIDVAGIEEQRDCGRVMQENCSLM